MDRQKDIIEKLEKGLEGSLEFFGALTPDQLAKKIYQDGARWKAIEVVAHFITIERSMHRLFQNILDGGEGSPKDFDVDRFNKRQTRKLDGIAIDELLRQFERVRRQTIAMVESMSETDLDRQGNHAFHGLGSLERFIRWAYEHARMHEEEIQSVLDGSSEGEGQ